MDSYLDHILNTRKSSFQELIAAGWHKERMLREGTLTMTSWPRVICKDGESISVQVGEHMYCLPRTNEPGWTHVECGFPSAIPPDSWREYAEEPERPLKEKLSTLWFWALVPLGEIKERITHLRMRRLQHYTGLKVTRTRSYTTLKQYWRHVKMSLDDVFHKHTLKDTVFPYMPIDVLMDYINEHGGEDIEASWEHYNEVVSRGGLW